MDSTLIDSHCHLDDPRFDADRAEVLGRARAAGVGGLLVAGVDPAQCERARASLAGFRGIGLAVGLHPWAAARLEARALGAALEQLAQQLDGPEGPCALGEAGLDALRGRDGDGPARQEQALVAQLALARRAGLPVVLHVVRAHDQVLALLRRAGDLPGGVVHDFSGSPEQAARYRALGIAIGVGPALTRARGSRLPRVLQETPAELLLLETDAPDRPVERRGYVGRGEPADLLDVLGALAAWRAESESELATLTAANARRLFPRAPWS